MTIVNEMIFAMIETVMAPFYAEDNEEETPVLEFENENAFLDFEVKINEMIVNLSEFDNFDGGAFISTMCGDFATLMLYFRQEDNFAVDICTKYFIISY